VSMLCRSTAQLRAGTCVDFSKLVVAQMGVLLATREEQESADNALRYLP